MPFGSEQWMYASGADFTIDQSLRFEDGSSANLSRTPASAGNRKTWTISLWLKRGNTALPEGNIFSANTDTGDNRGRININSDDVFTYYGKTAGVITHLTTTQVFRDTSAWWHLLVAADTTQASASNRMKFYINGTQVTDFSTATYPALNVDLDINNNSIHSIGSTANVLGTYPWDGYMAEFHHIDGTALTPSSFGETGDYGEWKPIEVSGLTYGTNGFYLSFAGGGVMSATGGTITTDGDFKVNSFTADGTFTPSADGYVEYLVIAGGGGGAGSLNSGGGGGGAGAYRTGMLQVTASTAYSITVGAGGSAGASSWTGTGGDGADSIISGTGISTITSDGGGGSSGVLSGAGSSGGSGGGASGKAGNGAGNSTPGTGTGSLTTSPFGGDGGTMCTGCGSDDSGGGGGGGAGANGASTSNANGGNGGAGKASSITGSSVTYAGGGGAGGGRNSGSDGSGGSGGGGNAGSAGTANTGGGGGGTIASGVGYIGGSGIVIIRYKFQ
jgi:hypothetical protein